ncbi:hypothetical protein [Gemmatimonas sp.]|jgi:hypothetical protein|uniref:hypothetical protein n=1 Tax=Gemmatimonas sp. TaxID=1962908 RepID=UPI0037BF05F3
MIYRIRPDGTREVVSDAPLDGMHPQTPTLKRGPFDVLMDWLINAGIFAIAALCVAAAGTFVLWAWRRLDPPPEVQGTMLIIGGAAVIVGLIGSRDNRRRHW